VVNLFDKEPPLSSGAFGYDPGVSQHLLPGRTWSVEFARQF
jgi:outer membrane receptor protein involved in Fe transport